MYFNESNDTNIDGEFKSEKKSLFKRKLKPVKNGEKKKKHITMDTLLMFFYGFLLIVGIVLIIISIN